MSVGPHFPSLFADPSGAMFSACRRYRYRLWRCWAPGAACAFIGLNPSTADETKDDPTIRRCIGFAKRWGFTRFDMLNLYAWRSTEPRALLDMPPPPTEENLASIHTVARVAQRVVLCWGSHVFLGPNLAEQASRVRVVLREAKEANPSLEVGHLGTNKDKSPKHPLYLASDTAFQRVDP